MMKRYLFFCQLSLLPAVAVQAQFTAGSEGFFIGQDSQVSIENLTLKPSADFSLNSQTITISPTAIPGTPPSISRVYHFSTPINFAGVMGLFYQINELNGNSESTLKLASGNATFVSVAGGTVDIGQHYVSNTVSLTNFTSLTAAQENALPVNLIAFDVKRMENRTVLTWKTSREINSDYFEVQHSEDARTWTALGTIRASINSKADNEYSFLDFTGRFGTQYYRLKMVDTDGSYAYSKIRQIKLEAAEMIRAYPNPVTDKLLIGSKEVITSIKVTDLTGRSLLELSNPKPDQEFNLKSYPAGIYLIKVETANGKTQALKIIKQ